LVLDRFLDWLAHLPAAATYGVLMVLSAVENVFPPVPADVAVALGAFLAQRGELSATLLGVLCWLANTSSSAGMYLFARRHAEVFRSGWGRKLLSPRTLAALQHAYERHGMWGIFLSRFLPGFRAGVLPFAGITGMPPMRALVPAATASAIWYALLIVAGTALGLSWEGVKGLLSTANRVLALAALAAVVALGLWLWRRSRVHDR
jgi:membrane protein DedA with SNARE-associated domain